MPDRRTANRLFAAVYDPVTAVAERTLFARHREYLAADLSGRVLDLGAGTGAMFPAFAAAADRESAATEGESPDADTGDSLSIHAIDPDPYMRRRAERRGADLGLDVEFVAADAARLPYRDDVFDVVVASLVLCTVADLEGTLAEVARVLRPGCEFRVFEHVHGEGWYARLQDAVTPAWRVAAAGCHLNRETDRLLRDHEAYEVVELDRFDPPVPPVTPFVRGRLRTRE